MSAPVYLLLAGNSGVTALVGTNIFPAGMIPQEVTARPVITYQTIAGSPENVLTDRAPVDFERVQIDCWGTTFASAQAVADAVRAACENVAAGHALNCSAVCTSINGHDYDAVTKEYRASLDFSFRTLR